MNTAKILKRVPTLILIVCLAYACYRIHAILPDSGGGRDELAKGLDVMVKDVLEAGADEVRALASDALPTLSNRPQVSKLVQTNRSDDR